MQRRRLSPAYQASRLRAFGKRSGPAWLKARIWDWEFSTGKWDHLEAGVEPNQFYEVVERSLGGGRLLDLACGTGVVRCTVHSELLRRYVGLDISRSAIARARRRTAHLPPLPEGQMLVHGNLTESSVRDRLGAGFDLIVFKECIYYIQLEAVPALLRDMTDRLAPDGKMLFQIHDRLRWADHVKAVSSTLHVVEVLPAPDNRSIVLVTDRGGTIGDGR